MSELKWDQVQLPTFGGAVQNQIAAAKLLDDAIGKGITMNNNISENRRDNTMKGILGNLTQYTTGEEATQALRSGSLLDGVDLTQLNAEDLRSLRKDVMGVFDLENKGIKNTQGYLDHDQTRANTGYTKAGTANVYNNMRINNSKEAKAAAEAQAKSQQAAANQQFENYVLQNTLNRTPEEQHAFFNSDEFRSAQQATGAGYAEVEAAFNYSNKRMDNASKLGDGASHFDNIANYEINKKNTDDINNIYGSSSTDSEFYAKLDEYADTLSPTERSNLPKLMATRFPKLDSGRYEILNDTPLITANELTSVTNTLENREIDSANAITPESIVESTVPITADTLESYYNDIAGVKPPEEFKYVEGDISEVNMDRINPDLYFNKYNNLGHKDGNTLPFDKGDFLRATESKEYRDLRNLPWTEENLSLISNRIREHKGQPTKTQLNNESKNLALQKERVNKEAAPLVSKYVDDFKSQGLSGKALQDAAKQAAQLEAINTKRLDKALDELPKNESVSMNDKDATLAQNYMNSPTATSKTITSNLDTIRIAAGQAIKGVGYYESSNLSDIPNNIGDIAKAIVDQSGDPKLKVADVSKDLRKMGNNISADPRSLGALYKATGNLVDIDAQKTMYKASQNPTNNATMAQMEAEYAYLRDIDSRITTLATDIASLSARNRKGGDAVIKRKQKELEYLTTKFNSSMQSFEKYSQYNK